MYVGNKTLHGFGSTGVYIAASYMIDTLST